MKSATAFWALAVLAPAAASCDEFRCGQWLVSSETSVADLVKKCGEPTSRQVSTEDVRAHAAGGGTQKLGTVPREVWRYNGSSRAEAMVVTIVDGKIESIERGN